MKLQLLGQIIIIIFLLIQVACQGIAALKEKALWRPMWNKLKTRLMPKWRTTVVNPGNLEADNKRVWLLPQAVTKTQKTRAK